MSETAAKIEKMQELLLQMAQHLYQAGDRRIQPNYPWVLVSVLPKEQVSHGIILPGTQNKVVYEGIVLEVWRPFWKKLKETTRAMSGKLYEETKMTEVLMESQLQVGDHVLFPHYEGLPFGTFLDEKYFRLIKENAAEGKMVYERNIDQEMMKLINESYDSDCTTSYGENVVQALKEQYYITPRKAEPFSVSGL